MESETSLQCWQESNTCPYPETMNPAQVPGLIIIPYTLGFAGSFCLSGFATKHWTYFLSHLYLSKPPFMYYYY